LSILKSQSNPEVICKQLLFPLEQLIVQAEHAGQIVVNMRDFVRDSGFHAEDTDMNRLIKDTLSMLYYELMDFKLKMTLHLMEDLPSIRSNKIYIMQILLNLIRNSIEALRGANTAEPELTIETRSLNENIVVSITDNGPGVPIEIRDKVLDAYFTTKRHGTGIGLGICRSLIEAHGGKLSVDQEITNGACFSFTLPINKIT
ncbi:MAG TPA: PAS domain-containing sensor histidine kinase, partial [Legionella sp.]|nr:PAS domain-containing sensor histidine kinase [Legionella sp.]